MSAPRALKLALSAAGYDCMIVQDAGWTGKRNGELLALADAAFDVFITIDQNLRYQQNLAGRNLAVIILRARSNRIADLKPLFSVCVDALRTIQPSTVVQLP